MNISAEKLGKRFNREWIFRHLSFNFETGNTYAIVGPNGSGKSTLLQVLWGQLPFSEGKLIYTLGSEVIAPEEIFNHLSIAAPALELIEEYTLREMVRFHFRFKKIREGIRQEEVLERIGLSHASDKLLANFSSGMRQRVKLGLAFFSTSDIIFLDEPTTNLDRKSILWYQDQLSALPSDLLILIASNQEHEYPQTAKKIDVSGFKKVTIEVNS
jgi:ABC-type multidrug transport system ATPase subunit